MQQVLARSAPSVTYRCAGELIRFKRKQMGFSQKYVAAKVRMSQSALSKIEAGVNVMPRKIMEITSILKLDHNTVMSIAANKSYAKDHNEDDLTVETLKSILHGCKKDTLLEAIKLIESIRKS